MTAYRPAQDTYDVTATREGRWWVLDVPGIGVTQARTLSAAREWVTDLIETMTDTTPAADAIRITVAAPPGFQRRIAATRRANQQAADAQRKAADRSRALVRDLTAQKYSQADIATMLGVSRQRVGQLAANK